MTKQLNIRLPEPTINKINRLAEIYGSQAKVIIAMTEKFYTKEIKMDEQSARKRMAEMDFSPAQMDFIFADWPNWDEHLEWLATASREEIENWIDDEAIKYDDLQSLTNHEAGAVQYEDGTIWIGNWSSIEGLPREFATGTIGLDDDLSGAKPCETPEIIKKAINEHEAENGDPVSTDGFRSWKIGNIIVTIQKNWN